MLRKYSHTRCENLVQIRTAVAEIQHFFSRGLLGPLWDHSGPLCHSLSLSLLSSSSSLSWTSMRRRHAACDSSDTW